MNPLIILNDFIKDVYPLKQYRKYKYQRSFFMPGKSWPRFFGLFDSIEEAQSIAKKASKKFGYDHPEVAKVNYEVMAQTWTSDYPVIFWLSKLISLHKNVFDLGGHLGTKYRAFLNYIEFPADFIWTVCDLPTIIEEGKIRSNGLAHLRFTVNKNDVSGKEILLMSGVLQYADFDIEEYLSKLENKPLYILINKLPIHKSPEVFTLENLHHSIVTYRIINEDSFLEKISSLGYTVVDKWTVPESKVRVPFTNLGEPVHMGFYLKRM